MTSGPSPAEQFAALFEAQIRRDTMANRIARHLAGQNPDPVEAGRAAPEVPQRAVDPSQGSGGPVPLTPEQEFQRRLYPYTEMKYDPPHVRDAILRGDREPNIGGQ